MLSSKYMLIRYHLRMSSSCIGKGCMTQLQRIGAVWHQSGYEIMPGNPLPFGASFVPGGVNFSIYSNAATECALVLFRKGDVHPMAEIPIPQEYRIGAVFPIIVLNLDWENIEYGFRMDGPEGNAFNRNAILLDPYAKAVGGRSVWGVVPDWNNPSQHRARIVDTSTFDWAWIARWNVPSRI
jgi:isoamylase